MLNFVICDDNKIVLDRLAKMLEAIFIEHNYDAAIKLKTTDSDELVNYMKECSVDVVILDINLKSNVSGLKLAEDLRKLNHHFYLIFTTGHLEYALIAYRVKTFDYIPKPVTVERLESTVTRIFDDVMSSTNKLRFIRVANSKIILKASDILYIKKDGMKLVYHTITSNYSVYSSFIQIENTLPKNFVRCHKSYIVNMDNIQNISTSKNIILFTNDETCAIGPKYKSKLLEVLNNYGTHTKHMEFISNA